MPWLVQHLLEEKEDQLYVKQLQCAQLQRECDTQTGQVESWKMQHQQVRQSHIGMAQAPFVLQVFALASSMNHVLLLSQVSASESSSFQAGRPLCSDVCISIHNLQTNL